MTTLPRPALPLVAEAEGVGRQLWEARPLRCSGGSKMAAAEGDCGVGADADRELEELLESKPSWEDPRRAGVGTRSGR